MPYLTYEEFKEYNLGVIVREEEFNTLLGYAQRVIDSITFHQVPADPPDEIREATAVQVAYLSENGGAGLLLAAGGITGESIGKYSYSVGAADGGKSPAVCPLARDIIRPTGLLFAGVRRCEP